MRKLSVVGNLKTLPVTGKDSDHLWQRENYLVRVVFSVLRTEATAFLSLLKATGSVQNSDCLEGTATCHREYFQMISDGAVTLSQFPAPLFSTKPDEKRNEVSDT